MKKKVFFVAFVLMLSITGAVKSKGKFIAVRYIDTVNPNTCIFGAQLPSDCTNLPQTPAIVCVTPLGTFQRVYYQGTTCVNTYYRIP